ncbi:ABC transporter substrate-binding protein [Gordonia sp. CPCC 205333]|uniref:ABC transporter substrate-binding protein n=1 Tax=Gordonia sp. CPCC 205333 TaxID=3140790 RepID=UPI003AF335E7
MKSKLNKAIGIALAVTLFGFLAGCSTPDDEAQSSTAYTPVTVNHEFGSTQITQRPTRVVTLLTNWTDTLAALDIPITAQFGEQGYSGKDNKFPWTPAHGGETIIVKSLADMDITKLAQLNPDLILAGYVGQKETYDRLSKLAPTIPVMKKGATVDTWEDIATTTGKIFGKQDQAAKLVSDTNAKIEKFKTDNAGAMGKTFVFAQFQPTGGIGAVNNAEKDPSAGLLTQLGFKLYPPLAAQNKGGPTRSLISSERVDLLNSDLLIAWPLAANFDFNKIPGWTNLTAVRNGTVLEVSNDNVPAFGVPSAPSVSYVIDLLTPIAQKLA